MRAARYIALVLLTACKSKAAPQEQPRSIDATAIVADAAAPDAAPACVPRGEIHATAVEQSIRICGKAACVDVDGQGALHATPHVDLPEPTLTSATIETRDNGKLSACFHGKCRELGKAARELITRDPDIKREALAATVDLGLLVIPKVSPQLWSITDDKEIHLRGPGGEKELDDLRPVGNHLLATWLPPVEAMYGRNGRLLTSLFSSGTQLAMLDDETSAALTPDHRVYVFAADGETRLVELVPSVGFDDWVKEAGALAVLPDKTVAVVLVRAGGEASVIFIDSARGTVFRRWPLALCPG